MGAIEAGGADPARASFQAFDAVISARRMDLKWEPPHPALQCCVIVPAKNEEANLAALIDAIAHQRNLVGALPRSNVELLVLLNNCTDDSAGVIARARSRHPALAVQARTVTLINGNANVGYARQVLFDEACRRFIRLDRPHGLLLSTDADIRPAPDWIAQTQRVVENGADGVGGRIFLEPSELRALPQGVRRSILLDIGYRRALEEMRSLYMPEAHDPFPRHHQHFGGSFAVTAEGYARAGGQPACASEEDVGLFNAIVKSGGRFRHSPLVQVTTSARMVGRAHGGLADALQWWAQKASISGPILVESASAAEERLARLGMWTVANPTQIAPDHLRCTPLDASTGSKEEIHRTLCGLRERIAKIRPLSWVNRIQKAGFSCSAGNA